VDEKDLPRRVFFAGGLGEGIKKMLNFMDIGIKLMLHHRMKLLPERKIKGINSLQKMLNKAEMLGKGGSVR
jgi:quinone-modifying oxidoreductase subunit QmoC